jgi:NADH-quinone oxidoreductase subunit A
VVLDEIGMPGILAMAMFLFILLLGFAYDWKKGALEWD